MGSVHEQPIVTLNGKPSHVPDKPKYYIKEMVVSNVVLMLFVCANNSSIPLAIQYIHSRYEEFYTNGTNSSQNKHTQCLSNTSEEADEVQVRVQQSTSSEILKLSLCSQIPPIIVSMVVGSYSDHIGRKLLFISPLVGDICKYVIFSLVVKFHLSLNFLILSSLLEGFSGSWATFILASMAYAADVTKTQASRTFALAITDCLVTISMALGQLMTGFLIDNLGYFYPTVINLTLLLLATTIVIFGLTETVKKTEVKELSPVVHLKKVFGFYVNKSQDNTRCIFIASLTVYALLCVGINGKNTIEILYQLGPPFCWDPVKIGYYGGYYTVFTAICGLIAIKFGSGCVRVEILAVAGIFLLMGALILEGLANTDVMLFSVPLVSSISSSSVPVTRSVMSRMVAAPDQGAIFSSMAAVDTLTGAVGSAVVSSVYGATVDVMRGAAFLVLAAVVFMAAMVKIVVIVKLSSHPSYVLHESSPEHQKIKQKPDYVSYGTLLRKENNNPYFSTDKDPVVI